jgi:hypothetical protein
VDFFIEGTIFTRILFVSKRTLDFPAAKGSGNKPADSSGEVPLVETIVYGINWCRAKTLFIDVIASRLPAAFHIFPTIDFFIHLSGSLSMVLTLTLCLSQAEPTKIGSDLTLAARSKGASTAAIGVLTIWAMASQLVPLNVIIRLIGIFLFQPCFIPHRNIFKN